MLVYSDWRQIKTRRRRRKFTIYHTLKRSHVIPIMWLMHCHPVQGPFVAAGDIRRRLSESLSAPQALFKRDPEDPSGRTGTDCREIQPHLDPSLPSLDGLNNNVFLLCSCCSEGTMGRKGSKDSRSFTVWSRAQLEYPLLWHESTPLTYMYLIALLSVTNFAICGILIRSV